MSKSLIIGLIVYSILWFFIILKLVKNNKISIRYSMIWLFMAFILFLVGITPSFMRFVASSVGFQTTSNLVIAIILTVLIVLTLVLTMIVTNQKSQINKLIQEISILKQKK